MFYDVFCELCAANNLTPSGGAAAIGFNRATVTTWKNTGKAPKGNILLKVAQYFEVPVDFLLQRPPFDYWEAINADRRGLIAATGIDHDLLKIVWGIDAFDPYACRLKDFVSFLSLELLSAIPLDDGSWGIVLRPEHQKAPTQQPGERSTAQNDEEEEMLLLARHMEPIPEEDRKELKEQFKKSIDMYLKAMGLSETEDK